MHIFPQPLRTTLCRGAARRAVSNGIGALAGYEEGRRLRNITTWLLSDTVQDSLPQFGLVPTYQNASVSPSLRHQSIPVYKKTCGRVTMELICSAAHLSPVKRPVFGHAQGVLRKSTRVERLEFSV